MLLLVTIGLVVVGAVSLVIGFVSNSLGPIYLSIACSVIAGIVLVVFSRMARRQEGAPASAAAAPSRSSWAPSAPSTPPSAPSAPPPPPPAPTPPPPPPPRPEPVGAGFRRGEPTRTMTTPEDAGAAATTTLTSRRPEPDALAEEPGFPIEGYDGLRASQVIARLDDLDLDELDMVREREERGKGRATIIRRVDARIDELEAAEGGVADLEPEPLAPEPEPVAAAPVAEPAMAMPAAGAGDDDFPIPDYDSLSSDQIIAVLDDLSDDELDMVAEREEQGRNRVEILDYIDDMFEEVPEEPAAAAPAAPPPPPPVKAVKKAAKKAPAVKVGKAAPTVKVPGRKAAAGKVAAVPRTPVSKAPAAGRGTAKKAAPASPVTKAAGRRAAAPAPAGRVAKAVKATKVPKAVKGITEKAKAVVGKEPAGRTAKKVPAKKAAAKRVPGVKKTP